jgi:hypothetical protein
VDFQYSYEKGSSSLASFELLLLFGPRVSPKANVLKAWSSAHGKLSSGGTCGGGTWWKEARGLGRALKKILGPCILPVPLFTSQSTGE